MRSTLFNRRRRELVTSILLVALALRALIPVGFMPASGEGFSLTICRADFPAPSAPQDTRRHPRNPPHIAHSAFGHGPGGRPRYGGGGVVASPIPRCRADPPL